MEKELLRALERDARLTPAQLAVMLGCTEAEVKSAIERLEKRGIILRYKTVVNWEKAGKEAVSALIEVKVMPQREVGFDAVAERIYRFPEARSVTLLSGTYDLLVEVVGNDMKEVAGFVTEKLAPLDGVQGTTTHFILRRYKSDGDILSGEPEVRRLPIVP
ncbi:MAG: Lrp/AsnC family transcriptional regulator [Chloroflexi bacterium]|nr:Lrp/AsnC family transcriptional regulator [Chloroflexota bacterium]